ncbi:uncharacterized protein LOC123917247 [Trifolium pratense]|uniref:Uncharacterized protein n=1 Tax=Trifolium pratense TaxID=57577 RepID=A0ACB0J575_TRIPR|nr:uncharacterized protein LOC123917247 [Trifolium pratense]XP_045824874.1 uncharacterized protein LOC123917247 [Trifolium pratense]CAJ2639607.1 unnamed protein product [Trifolium pratense]
MLFGVDGMYFRISDISETTHRALNVVRTLEFGMPDMPRSRFIRWCFIQIQTQHRFKIHLIEHLQPCIGDHSRGTIHLRKMNVLVFSGLAKAMVPVARVQSWCIRHEEFIVI